MAGKSQPGEKIPQTNQMFRKEWLLDRVKYVRKSYVDAIGTVYLLIARVFYG